MTVEMKETDAVTFIIGLSDQCFAYALANGTVGVYHKRNRLWRVKSKNTIVALASFDVDNDGHPELVCGWSHGRFDARQWQTGEVVFKEKLDAQHSIAALVVDDWLQMGHAQLIVCSQLGQGDWKFPKNKMKNIFRYLFNGMYKTVRSYLSSDLELTSLDRIKDEAEEEVIRRLLIRKQNLLAELEHKQQNVGSPEESSAPEPMEQVTKLELTHDEENVLMSVDVEGGGLVHAVIIFAEGLFPNGESHALHLYPPISSVRMPLPVQRHLAVDLHVNVLVDSSSNELLKVIEIIHPLPTFSRFKSVPWPSTTESPSATVFRVRTRLQERIQRVISKIVTQLAVAYNS